MCRKCLMPTTNSIFGSCQLWIPAIATQEVSEDGCIFKVLCEQGTFLSLVGRINETEQKTTPSLNSSTVKGKSCVCTAVGSMSLTPTAPSILY